MTEATILQFTARDLPTDGGKSRILRKRDNFKFRNFAEPIYDPRDDLLMDHTDPEHNNMPSDSAYSAPDWDPA
jgi:hypothetical protein